MPKSRNKATHKQSIKNRHIKMSEQHTQAPNPAAQLPDVRSIPTWKPDTVINITGYEWEALSDGMMAIGQAQQAMQAILSRNIVEGNITMQFEKLNAETLQYGPMEAAEAEPYIKSFNDTIATIKQQQANQQAEAEKKVEALKAEKPTGKIVGVDGQPLK